MVISADVLQRLADSLYEAETSGRPIPPLSAAWPALSIDDAYAVQKRNVDRYLAQGVRVVGKKIGLTSAPMQRLLGVHEPDFGHLLDHMSVGDGRLPAADLINAKIEAEIAFILKNDLAAAAISRHDVIAATAYVVPALEIVDSRVADWQITIIDTVADNASSGRFVLGDRRTALGDVDLARATMRFYKNDSQFDQGQGSAVLGDPITAVCWLAERMYAYGVPLKAGEIILSGALTAAVPVRQGDAFAARFDVLGDVAVCFT